MEKKPSLDSFLLSPPVLVVVFTAALSFGVHQLTSQAVSSAFPHSFGELVIRLSILSSILLSITILFSWLLISGAIQATAIVLWDRGAPFHETLKLVGYCFTPLLLYSFFLQTSKSANGLIGLSWSSIPYLKESKRKFSLTFPLYRLPKLELEALGLTYVPALLTVNDSGEVFECEYNVTNIMKKLDLLP